MRSIKFDELPQKANLTRPLASTVPTVGTAPAPTPVVVAPSLASRPPVATDPKAPRK